MSENTLPLYQYRVIAERDELVDKLLKLHSFVAGPLWQHVAVAEQHRLIAQRTAMELYARVLAERIANFGEGI